MRGKTILTEDARRLLERLRMFSAEYTVGGRNKTPGLILALRAACAVSPSCPQLPPLRELAAAAGTTMMTMQKVVAALVRTGVLQSRPRQGIFLATPRPARTSPAALANTLPAHGMSTASFGFATDSAADFQQQFWEEAANDFHRACVNLRPHLFFAPDSPERNSEADLCEQHGLSSCGSDPTRRLFLGGLVKDGFPGLLPNLIGQDRLLLYYRTNFLFYHPALLQRLRLAAPEYGDFAGQTEYLRHACASLSASGHPLPVSILYPHTLTGGAPQTIASALRTGKPERLLPEFRDIVALARLFRYDVAGPADDFLAGRCPFFLGYSVNYWEMVACPPSFGWRAHPIYRADDTLFLLPVLATIRADSRHPLEALRFVEHLLSPELQNQFQRQGNLPAGARDAATAEALLSDDGRTDPPQALAIRHAEPFVFANEQELYLAQNVYGGELWDAVIRRLDPEEGLRRAVALSRHFQPAPSGTA